MTTKRNVYPAIGIPETTYSDGWERDDPFTIAAFDSGTHARRGIRRAARAGANRDKRASVMADEHAILRCGLSGIRVNGDEQDYEHRE